MSSSSGGAADQPIAIIGAGIIGLSTAVNLARAGRRCMVFDPQPPGTGASFGNSGLLTIDSSSPMAMPGMLTKIPKWLMDPLGPVAISPRYLVSAAPWLLRWIRASRMDVVQRATSGLHALNGQALDRFQELLGNELFQSLVSASGMLLVWESETEAKSDAIARQLREQRGDRSIALHKAAIRELCPEISPAVKRGILFPRHAHLVNPLRLTRSLAEIFVRTGGELLQERVMKVLPIDGRFCVLTNTGNHMVQTVVVAAGAWSRAILGPLGIQVPLDTERGYHVSLASPSINLKLPIVNKTRGFAATPMDEGLRISGTVEIAGLHAPPNEKRALRLRENAEASFPGLKFRSQRLWMGYRPSFPDSLPVIGPVPNRAGLYVAFGHGHYGMVSAAATGRLLCELITGKPPHIDPGPYWISRFW
jgi:D-amino-acid dehydrogenase